MLQAHVFLLKISSSLDLILVFLMELTCPLVAEDMELFPAHIEVKHPLV